MKNEPTSISPGSSGVLIKSGSPEDKNSLIARVQERTLMDSRLKKTIGTPIALCFRDEPSKPSKLEAQFCCG